ncbi:efflux transporter outer membrane subunit [Methyloversatilis sp.]|uniref:efflux transporter outer membrane subunit n=1 Tax=Methyloversatilis sp. TaxID=2569862 RepID=UPI002732AF01|nr:efflux transporter outer membrane subunit [Methyloversatilis sp.]MDP2870772.1 efflux transporter outer membrane subunit [Methyloversatilis sp.]MDP3455535.1 efflux transporter outer membrane subunit [Methyloversatilis sp.]MDP3578150.1 efflux transporter outer membrane subunit [Methyloversatilis sp.]
MPSSIRRLPGAAVWMLAILTLGGCTVGPDFRRPEPPASMQFVSADALALRSAPVGADDPARWWTGFDDPLLDRIVARVLAGNLDLTVAAARLEQARAGLAVRSAIQRPSGQLGAEAASGRLSVQTPLGRLLDARPGFDRTADEYALNAGSSWELDLFGGLQRAEDAARADYLAAGAGVAGARLAVVAQAADTYIHVRALQSRLQVLHEQIDTQRRLVGLIALQVSRGLAAELQHDQAQGALAEVEAALPALEAGRDAAMFALDVLTGDTPGHWRAELEPPAALPRAPAVATAGGPASLIRRRPDLMAAEYRLAASNARIGEAIAAYYPRMALTGLLGFATAGGGSLIASGAAQARLAAGLRWRLFDFGRVDAEVAAARGGEAEALAHYRQAVLRATEEVENAFTALVKREAQAATLSTGEAALNRARGRAFTAWQGGVVSLVEVLDADSRLLRTRDARIQAEAEAARAAVASFRALGGGWQPAGTDDTQPQPVAGTIATDG